MSDRQTARAYAENPEGLGDSRPEAQGPHGDLPQDHLAAEGTAAAEALDGLAQGLAQEVMEHRRLRLASVVAPCVLVDVALQTLVRDRVVDASDAVLEEPKEPVDGLRMHVPVHVDAGVVV